MHSMYLLTPFHAHCYTPACFSPQGTILREYFVSRVNKIRVQMYKRVYHINLSAPELFF